VEVIKMDINRKKLVLNYSTAAISSPLGIGMMIASHHIGLRKLAAIEASIRLTKETLINYELKKPFFIALWDMYGRM
jgi:hypothetical protein